MSGYSQIAFTPNVTAMQSRMGSRRAYARADGTAGPDLVGPDEAAFIAARDSFYLATVSETGWPYVQHRGGPTGFVHVLDEHTLAFADARGNKQYVSVGNLATNDRVALIFVDYPNQGRLKVFARASLQAAPVAGVATDRDTERVVVLHVEGLDWNCQRNIHPRFTEGEVAAAVAPLRARIADLEAETAALRAAAR